MAQGVEKERVFDRGALPQSHESKLITNGIRGVAT